MPEGIELGKAYVQIIPSAEGIKGKITEALGGEADSAGKASGGRFGKAFGGALKLAGAGIAAAATGIGAIGKQAVSAYADFEQLSGGIETLFGAGGKSFEEYAQQVGDHSMETLKTYRALKEAEQTVMDNAARAFHTAGLSANDYMETVTSFSASLIQSLGGDTVAAAQYADMAVTDMADNANKMGTSMESIQTAYAGFAKQNYTMLDNLKLGYGGTKEEMERLIRDAEQLSDTFSVTHTKTKKGADEITYSYADIVDAIHIVQTEMGITGTTAKEGADTISGSISTMKAAWSNLLAGMANGNADQGQLISNLMTSVKNVSKNLLPVIRTALKNAAVLVKELAPMIAQELPGLIQETLPSLIDAAIELAVGLGTALAENAPEIIGTLVNALIVNAPKLIEGAATLVWQLVSGIFSNLPQIAGAALRLVDVLFVEVGKGIGKLLQAGKNLVTGLWQGIQSAATWLWEKISGWLGGIWDGIKEFFGIASPSKEMAWAGEMLAEGLAGGIDAAGADAVSAASRMNADVLAAMGGDGFGFSGSASGSMEIRHSGTIRVEGVSSSGELVASMDIIMEEIVNRLRREVRYA